MTKMLLILAVVAFALVACGGDTAPPPVPTPVPTEAPIPTPVAIVPCTATGASGAHGPIWKGDCEVTSQCMDIGNGNFAGDCHTGGQ